MRQPGEFLKTTITAGLLALFPMFACVFVIVKIARLLTDFIEPLLIRFVPQYRSVGVVLADTASVLILLFLCFVVGVIVRTPVGSAFPHRSSRLLSAIPGYTVFVKISRILFDRDDVSGTPVVVQRGDSRLIGFMMEQNNSEEVTVFFPDAPSLFSGTVEIVKASTVLQLNVHPSQAARVIASFGTGTSILLADRSSDKSQSQSTDYPTGANGFR